MDQNGSKAHFVLDSTKIFLLSDDRPKAETAAQTVIKDWFIVEDRTKVFENEVWPGSLPFVNGLVVVTDNHDIGLLSSKKLDQSLLSKVDVLVLIYDQVLDIATEAAVEDWIVLQDVNGSGDKVIIGQSKLVLAKVLKACIDGW